uniref:Inositol polyphosphate-related phosphatase domain-containing protein n=1 Tax=Panagrolaimus davidi TaxID=227884 RepID=A0A914P2T4_9BILA
MPTESTVNWLKFDPQCLPDFIVIGIQEMDIALTSYIFANNERENKWLDGGVGISLNINNTSVCFLNCHLAAGDKLLKRNEDFHTVSNMKFHNNRGIYDHDVVFWLGDLNYRLDSPYTFGEVLTITESGQTAKLLQHDQLQQQQLTGQAFRGFKETLGLPFLPTYKFDNGTSRWDTSNKKRIPAWCDRILFWTKSSFIRIAQSEYCSVEEVIISDHKPVIAKFLLQTKI